MKPKTQNKTEVKNLKHSFTPEERNQIGGDLARCIGALRGVNSEFDQVKAGFKARIREHEAWIDNLSTSLMNGFEMRNQKCVVAFRPKQREKDYMLESDVLASEDGKRPAPIVLTEPMTPADFEADLFLAESAFEFRTEIELFPRAGDDSGLLVVGKFGGKWFSALRIKIGKLTLDERLDSEQRNFKERQDAVSHAGKRAKEWAKANLKNLADGFTAPIDAAIKGQKDIAQESEEPGIAPGSTMKAGA